MLLHISTAILAFASAVLATNPIKRQGANFVDANTGARFEIIGIDYQPGANSGFNPGADPLSDGQTCLRDAIVMQQLGVNTIRVYNLDPTVSHDECASIFNSAGIYMLLDVNTPKFALNSEAPWTTYTGAYLTHIFQVVEAFASYPNLLGFVAGNENINDLPSGLINPPYVKAVIRDLKNYIAKNINREIPVGYAAAQINQTLVDQWNYFRCSTTGQDDDPAIADFFALNSYSWCGKSSFKQAGYDILVQDFASTNTPLFFGEYGCNQFTGAVNGGPRPFTEVAALYGEPMRGVFSGGLVFEYTMEVNNFGLVIVNSDKSLTLRQDFINLQNQYNALDIKQITANNGTATSQAAPKCAASLITQGLTKNFTLPSIPDNGTDLIDNGVTVPSPPKTMSVTSTALPAAVTNLSGSKEAWTLKQLSNDQSNAPSGNTAGGAGNGTSGSGSSSNMAMPTAMPRVAGLVAGSLVMGAMIL